MSTELHRSATNVHFCCILCEMKCAIFSPMNWHVDECTELTYCTLSCTIVHWVPHVIVNFQSHVEWSCHLMLTWMDRIFLRHETEKESNSSKMILKQHQVSPPETRGGRWWWVSSRNRVEDWIRCDREEDGKSRLINILLNRSSSMYSLNLVVAFFRFFFLFSRLLWERKSRWNWKTMSC